MQTLLVDGVDIDADRRYLEFEGWGDLFSTATPRGNNIIIPGQHGETFRQKDRDTGVASVQFAVNAGLVDSDRAMAAVNKEWFDLVALCSPRRRSLELTRVLDVLTEDGIEVTRRQVASAELGESIRPRWITHGYQRGTLTFRLLDGCWFDEDSTSWDIPSGRDTLVPARGTTDTSRIFITLTGGVGVQTLTNVSAGVAVSIDWTGLPSTAKVTIAVDTFTVMANGASALTRVSHLGDRKLMIIDPDLGDNRFTLTSGAAKLSYYGAWL